MRLRHRAAAVIAVGMLATTAAGCSPTLNADGHQLATPDQPLQRALDRVRQDNDAGIQNNSVTVSDATRCFYTRPAADSDDITDTVACGPVRRIGRSDTQIWDTYRLSFARNADGDTTARLGDRLQQGITEDTAILVAPDGSSPAPISQVPKPQVPQTAVTDHAVALPADRAPTGLTFTALDQPARLLTPTATIEVIGQGRPTTVPTALVAGQHDPAGPAPYYRPAAGQTLYAYRVRISAPSRADVPASTSFGGPASDRSVALRLGLTGKRTIAIAGTVGGNQAAPASTARTTPSTLTLACGSVKDHSTGCRPQDQELVLLATVPAGDPVSLRATVAGGHQSVDLPGGQLSTDVSQLDYDRGDVTASLDRRLKVGPVTVPTGPAAPATAAPTPTPTSTPTSTPTKDPTKGPTKARGKAGVNGDPTATASAPAPATAAATPDPASAHVSWSLQVDSATLAAFDPARGWAGPGRAWLLVSTSGYAATDGGRTVDVDRVSSLRLLVDGRSVAPSGLRNTDLADHPDADVVLAFDVPESLTAATLQFRPTGRVTTGGTPRRFTAAQAATLDLRLPG